MKYSPFTTAHQLIEQRMWSRHEFHEHILRFPRDKLQRDRPWGGHAWMTIIIKKRKLINEWIKCSDIDWRASDWKLEECGWMCRGEDRRWKKGRQWTFWSPLWIQKDESSPSQHTHSASHMPSAHKNTRSHTDTHIQRSIRVGEWPVHLGPWCAITKWQPVYWSNKNNGLKRNKTNNKRSQQCINQVAVIKVNLPAFFGMLTDRQMLPESHRKQNETKITKWQYLFTAILFSPSY